MEKTLGGDRLGSGNKQKVHLHGYERSSHNQSRIWRSSMASGVLTPFLTEIGLNGTTFDIDLDIDIQTLPTLGPLFGSYKVQLDIFQCPIRLYQGQLHMNKLGIGMKMDTVKLPQIEMEALSPPLGKIDDNYQINPSSIFAHLGIRGLGKGTTPNTVIEREFTGLTYLMYWDIVKHYYANKQEEIGAVIHNPMNTGNGTSTIISALYFDPTGGTYETWGVTAPQVNFRQGEGMMEFHFDQNTTQREPDPSDIQLGLNSTGYKANEVFGYYDWNPTTKVLTMWETNQTIPDATYGLSTLVNIVNNIPNTNINPLIQTFPLENIDTMREDILMAVKQSTPFVINKNSIAPYGLALQKGDTGTNAYCKTAPLEGLALKTYQSDLFNNWISTEWIDGEDGITAITAIDTSAGNFTIDQFNISMKVYNMLNRIAVSGGSWDDWQDAVYDHERYRQTESPMYMGGLSKELVFQEVISNAAAINDGTEQPLGTLAGRGILTSKHKGGKVIIRVDTPSYIIGIVSLTPRIDYSQGNRWDYNLKTMDDFHKPALDQIGFQDLITDQQHWGDTTIDETTGAITFKSAGKQPAWINYMTAYNEVKGNFAIESEEMWMVLNRRYEADATSGIKDLTTYIDPSKFNHIFANARTDAQNFRVQISTQMTSRRKMSGKIMPSL